MIPSLTGGGDLSGSSEAGGSARSSTGFKSAGITTGNFNFGSSGLDYKTLGIIGAVAVVALLVFKKK